MAKVKTLKNMTEAELREYKVPWPQTLDELNKIINDLAERKHDYGTAVYGMSIASVATFYYMSHKLGVTGFQASCADLDNLKRTRRYKNGFHIINYENLMFPQFLNNEHFPSVDDLIKENKEMLKKEAKKKLEENEKEKAIKAHPAVIAHWKKLSEL